MKTTANLGLKMPEGTDIVNINDLNDNATKIDTEITNVKNSVAGLTNGSVKAKAAEQADNAAKVNGLTVQTAVPANAKFTDTVYTHPTSSGNKHIPAGGSSGQILRYSADGTAVWGADNNTTYSVATASANGLMSAAMVTKLNGVATGANNYTHPTTAGNKHIPSGGSTGQVLQYGGSSGTAKWGSPDASSMWKLLKTQSISVSNGNAINIVIDLSSYVIIGIKFVKNSISVDNTAKSADLIVRSTNPLENDGYGYADTWYRYLHLAWAERGGVMDTSLGNLLGIRNYGTGNFVAIDAREESSNDMAKSMAGVNGFYIHSRNITATGTIYVYGFKGPF